MDPAQLTQYEFLKRELRVHISELHRDAEMQPVHMNDAGDMLADLKAVVHRKKLAVEREEAKVDKDARRNPEKYGLTKVTENTIKSAIALAPAVQEAQEELVNAEQSAGKVSAVVDALGHRKSMIQDEVRLYLSNYFGEVTVRDMSETKTDLTDKKVVDHAAAVGTRTRKRRGGKDAVQTTE